jgi:hypothetical protein
MPNNRKLIKKKCNHPYIYRNLLVHLLYSVDIIHYNPIYNILNPNIYTEDDENGHYR